MKGTVASTLPDVGFVRLPTVLTVFPVGRSTWWAGVKSGRFPRPVKLGPRVTAWNVADIKELLENLGVGRERS
jgi:prophage regulatory protein